MMLICENETSTETSEVSDLPSGLDEKICYHFTHIHFDIGESSLAWYIFNCVINAIFSMIASLSNLLVLVAIRRTPSLHTPSGTLLFGLALSDLGVGLIVHPLFFMQILAKVIRHKSLFCETGISVEITANALCIVSLLTVTTVSVDRYLALRLHLRYKELVTNKRAILLLVCVWVFSSTFGSLWLWKHDLVKIVAISIIIASLSTASYSYINIYRIVVYHRLIIHVQRARVLALQKDHHEAEDINVASIKKQAISTFWVYCVLAVCFTPYLCTVAVIEANGITTTTRISYELTATLIFVNSSLNPLIYCWRMREINDAVRQAWKSIFSWC